MCCFSVLSCSGVLWCECLSPRTWTVCSWKHTWIHVRVDTWSLSVSHYHENWGIWLPFTLRSVCVLIFVILMKFIMSVGATPGGGDTTVCVCLQKAIMECDEEWAMNKKVVDLSSKDIRQAVNSFFSFLKDLFDFPNIFFSFLCFTFLCILLSIILVNYYFCYCLCDAS